MIHVDQLLLNMMTNFLYIKFIIIGYIFKYKSYCNIII